MEKTLTTSQISQDHLGSVESQGHRRGTDAAEALGIAGDRWGSLEQGGENHGEPFFVM